MYAKHVAYHLRFFSFCNYLRTPLVCFICIKQTVTDAVLYFSSALLGWNNIDKMNHADYYTYVGLLRVSRRITECFGDKEYVTLFHGNTRYKHKNAYTKQWKYIKLWTDS